MRYEGDAGSEDSFATAFARAVDRRGIGLNQLARELARADIEISATTLSYWRTGVRRPGRRSSLDAVRELERILEVESGALLARVVGPRLRGRPMRESSIWFGDPEFARRTFDLFDQVGLVGEPRPLTLMLHERVVLDARGHRREEHVTKVIRAASGDVRSLLIGQVDTEGVDGPWALTHLGAGTATATAVDREHRVLVVRVDLPETLRHGDTMRIDYGLAFPHAAAPTMRHEQWFSRTMREHVVNLQFDEAALPVEVESYTAAEGEDPYAPESRRVEAVHGGFVQSVHLDVAPGFSGMRWRYPGQDSWPTADRAGAVPLAGARPGEGTPGAGASDGESSVGRAWRTFRAETNIRR